MAQISEVIRERVTFTVGPDTTVFDAARLMTEHHIGAVPVLRDGKLLGIFSERDLMTRVVALGRGPGSTRVSEVMTAYPRTVPPDETVDNCLFMMKEFGFRHLPICDGDNVQGIVSLRDIILYQQRLAARERA
ncbi:MAG TPA: CBS domain-containing protein [Terriglobales bacterium]|nr:CBS domain-containing protein [Terriglobales bacterium]